MVALLYEGQRFIGTVVYESTQLSWLIEVKFDTPLHGHENITDGFMAISRDDERLSRLSPLEQLARVGR